MSIIYNTQEADIYMQKKKSKHFHLLPLLLVFAGIVLSVAGVDIGAGTAKAVILQDDLIVSHADRKSVV